MAKSPEIGMIIPKLLPEHLFNKLRRFVIQNSYGVNENSVKSLEE